MECIYCKSWFASASQKERECTACERAFERLGIVRCKDCKYYELGCSCHYHAADENGTPIHMKPDDFCSCGERKEDANG